MHYAIGRDITERKQVAAKMARSQMMMERTERVARAGSWEWEVATDTVTWSAETYRFFGRDPAQGIPNLEGQKELYTPEDTQLLFNTVAKALEDGLPYDIELCGVRPNGEKRYCHILGFPERDDSGKILRLAGSLQDITERKHIEDSWRELKNLLEAAVANSPSGILIADAPDVTIRMANKAAFDIRGGDQGVLTGPEVIQLATHWQTYRPNGLLYRPEDLPLSRAVLRGETTTNEELILRDESGRERWVSANAAPIFGSDDKVSAGIVVFHDISERKQAEERIWKQANFDELTQLPNRRMFHDRLKQEIKKAHRDCVQVALLFIDLDNFKEVNDTLGHPVGDTLLVQAARRISACVREVDTVARLGGDEFTVLLTEIDDVNSIERVASSILVSLLEPFMLGDNAVIISASIGITLYPNDATDNNELLKSADQAMYAAKKLGRNRYHYFKPSLQEAALHRSRIINDLRRALLEQQFRVYFQPIVELASGRIHKVEALIRWQHPQRGIVSPSEFIPLAEETGMIHEMGDWVFKESVRWASRWREIYGINLLQAEI